MGTMFLPLPASFHILDNNFQDSFQFFFFFSSNNAERNNLNHVTHIILLLCGGGALRPKKVVPIEVFVCNLRPLLLLSGPSVPLEIHPATQMDTEKIHMVTNPSHIQCHYIALPALTTWWRMALKVTNC